ncbi:hypothetical protein [Kineococcus terrestris]|uniref:hypothetical protein n=1 Tax=Kineococcus terrestris TaxID=2044856 RepID=UPI0034DB6DEB
MRVVVRRALAATAATTAGLLLWRWVFDPAPGEGTGTSWTVLGLLLFTAAVLTDRATRPFVGTVTTAAAAGLANLLSSSPREQVPWGVAELLYPSVFSAVAAAAVAVTAGALHLLHRGLPRRQGPWAAGVALLGGSAWAGWLGWWALDEPPRAGEDLLLAGAAATLLLAAVAGELALPRWYGALFALGPALLLAAAPLVASDPLGIIAWLMLGAVATAGCSVVVGVVTAARSVRRRLSPAVS